MARFVLVHGAFSGAWIWGPLSDRLKATGHSVDVFDLPGSGNDYTPASSATLDAYAARLCEVLAPTPNRRSWPATVWVASSRPKVRHAVPAASGRSFTSRRSSPRTDRVCST